MLRSNRRHSLGRDAISSRHRPHICSERRRRLTRFVRCCLPAAVCRPTSAHCLLLTAHSLLYSPRKLAELQQFALRRRSIRRRFLTAAEANRFKKSTLWRMKKWDCGVDSNEICVLCSEAQSKEPKTLNSYSNRRFGTCATAFRS